MVPLAHAASLASLVALAILASTELPAPKAKEAFLASLVRRAKLDAPANLVPREMSVKQEPLVALETQVQVAPVAHKAHKGLLDLKVRLD